VTVRRLSSSLPPQTVRTLEGLYERVRCGFNANAEALKRPNLRGRRNNNHHHPPGIPRSTSGVRNSKALQPTEGGEEWVKSGGETKAQAPGRP
jgi:hypothetical protein